VEIPQTRRAHVALGANLGDPVATLRAAVADLASEAGRVVAASPVYRTAPIGVTDQPEFANAVVMLDTPLTPDSLLDVLLNIEARHGRVRVSRWGPRTLDLDLVAYEGAARESERLTLPHPRAHEREFVLRPLCDVDPDLVLGGRTARDWLAGLPPQGVEAAGETLM
jgi:2-amino-4-hydroxy-6-hydroxymethyldihydropteridine diphosphokinase